MLYIHIPFCKSRCIYCNFFSSVILADKKLYISALCKEIEQRSNYLPSKKLSSVYFGGGTPSLLNLNELEQIFEIICKYFEISPQTEITLECNPDDLNINFLQNLKYFPINRISVGIQSFNDSELIFLKRRHTAKQAKDSIKNLQDVGFDNISIDLIYSLPNQTQENWQKTLNEALSIDIQHISAYSLTYEKHTKLNSLSYEKKITPLKDEQSLLYFNILREKLLENGFLHYEISNFCLPNRQSKHNSGYWNGKKYLGVGASAHSYNGVSRQWNVANIEKYCEGIFSNKKIFQKEILSITDKYNEFIFLSLRTNRGINLQKLKNKFGQNAFDYCLKNANKYLKTNLLEIKNDFLKITPHGIFLSDGIMSDLFKM